MCVSWCSQNININFTQFAFMKFCWNSVNNSSEHVFFFFNLSYNMNVLVSVNLIYQFSYVYVFYRNNRSLPPLHSIYRQMWLIDFMSLHHTAGFFIVDSSAMMLLNWMLKTVVVCCCLSHHPAVMEEECVCVPFSIHSKEQVCCQRTISALRKLDVSTKTNAISCHQKCIKHQVGAAMDLSVFH